MLRVGVAHHFGWAVVVTASSDHHVVDRRRIELIETGLPAAPIHHVGGPHLLHRSDDPLDDEALTALVAEVRASVTRTASAALDRLVATLPAPVGSMSVRAWPADFPEAIAVQRRVPYESRADSVMYCQLLADLGQQRGWSVCRYDAKRVESNAAAILGSEPTTCSTALGPRWGRRGRRIIGPHSRRRSSPSWSNRVRSPSAICESEPMEIIVRPVSEALFDDVQTIFGTRGQPARCQCQGYRMGWYASTPTTSRAAASCCATR